MRCSFQCVLLYRKTRFELWLVYDLKYYVIVLADLKPNEPRQDISNNVVCATSKASDQPAHSRSLIKAFAGRLNVLWQFNYWLNTIWSFLAEQEAAQARLSLHLSKYHIAGNHMSRLKWW